MLSSFKRNERIIIVEDDRIRSVVIGPRQRLKPAIYVLAGAAALTFTSVGWIATAFSLSTAKSQLTVARHAVDALETQSSQREAALGRAGQGLAEARGALERAAAAEASLRQTPAAAPPASLADLSAAVKAAGDAIAATEAVHRQASAEPDPTEPAPDSGEAWPRGLAGALLAARGEADSQRTEAARLRAENERLATRAVQAEGRIQTVSESQVALLARLSDHADLRIGEIEQTLKQTGIDLEAVLRQLDQGRFGQGGPLVVLPEAPAEMTPEASQAMQRLEARLSRQARLRALYTLLPLSAPVDDFYVSSGFGRRRDPITSQWALHTGVDLVADLKTPVTVTAPGTVVSEGYEEGYGRNVEVDHGFGIRTRYAHLNKILVRQGDRVTHGQAIGLLGSSGRSVGPHVHYEVLIGGKPVDPINFMEKGRHVCEG